MLLEALLAAAPATPRVRAFLEALSGDELGWLADFYGAALMDPSLAAGADRTAIAKRIADSHGPAFRRSPQSGHKLLLLLEFLRITRAQPGRAGLAARCARA